MVNRQPSAGNLFLGQPSTDRSAFRTFPSNEFSFVDLSIDTHGQLAAKYRSSHFSSGVHDFLSRPDSLNAAFFESLEIDERPCNVFQWFDIQIPLESIPKETRVHRSWGSDRRSTGRLAKREDGNVGERSQEERREETRIEGNDREAEEKRDGAPRTEKERNRGVVVPADDEVALLLSLNTTRGS